MFNRIWLLTCALLLGLLLAGLVIFPMAQAQAADQRLAFPDADTATPQSLLRASDHFTTAMEYARDTWNSFVAMMPPGRLLPTDHMTSTDGLLAKYTSPTNIGSYIWSTIAARDLGIITPISANLRISATLSVLQVLTRHVESGQFYNWYDPETGDLLTIWPENGNTVCPFLSTVDNSWLAASLMMVTNALTETDIVSAAQTLVNSMDFGLFYDANVGLMYGGYWPPDAQPPSCPTGYTGHHYDIFNSEPRIAGYIGIAKGQVPPSHFYRYWRMFPDTCDWSWHEMRPYGTNVTYTATHFTPGPIITPTVISMTRYEGHYIYRGMRLVPSWGGSMFEALMPNLLVPEADWGPDSWGLNHPLYVQAQIEHGLEDAQYGYWGFSPASQPPSGYREYGVDALGMWDVGYTSNVAQTTVDYGFAGCLGRDPKPLPAPTDYISGVVTPHASFLALEFAATEVFSNLAKLATNLGAYNDDYGFYDAVQVNDGVGGHVLSEHFYTLDQGMIMAALANYLLPPNQFRNYFAQEIEAAMRPLMAREKFTAGLNPDYALKLAPGRTASARPNSQVVYTHVLRNVGRADDTYEIEAASAHGWPVQLSNVTTTLPLDHFQMVIVTLTIPSLLDNVTDTLTITATSTSSPTVQMTSTDTTLVSPLRIYLPVLLRNS